MMTRAMTFLLTLLSFSVFATQIEIGRGVTVLVANVEKVNYNEVELIHGDNQLVVEFNGRLKKKNKLTAVSTIPQIVIIPDVTAQQVRIELIAKNYKQLEDMTENKVPLFQVFMGGKAVTTSQVELPAKAGFLPYGDPLSLIKEYNKNKGLVFDSGKIRSLKKELEQVQSKEVNVASSEVAVMETETSLQMKLWYSRATPEERKAFKKWLVDQE